MAASGYTPIILLNSTTTGNTPTTSNLAVGELAINVTDGKLFFNQSGTIKVLANATYATSVSTISFGTTGLTPSTATNGVVTVAGTLAVANGGTGVTTSTGTGSVVLSTSPSLVTPILGTPTSVTLTNATGLPIATGVSGLGTGVATALAVNTGSAGAFKVKKWTRQTKLELVRNPLSMLPKPAAINSLIFLVVPEYTTRLSMLKSGQIDAMISAGGINPKDCKELARTAPSIVIKPVKNRYFDSIVWLNIDGEEYRNSGKVRPNALFGSKLVRQALTFAIDRQSIIDGFMGPEHATIVNTSLSPAYKAIANTSLDPYSYNPKKASALLHEAGWKLGQDGILQKQGKKFSFELAAPVGNPRRNYAATIVQQNLREIGIDCRLKFDESLIFLKNQNEFRYDAALSGMAAETLPFQLIIWGSDFAIHQFNSSAFQNHELDLIIAELNHPLSDERKLVLWKSYQKILHEEQPRTFLYYYDELEGFNRQIKNCDVNLISTLYNAFDWSIK